MEERKKGRNEEEEGIELKDGDSIFLFEGEKGPVKFTPERIVGGTADGPEVKVHPRGHRWGRFRERVGSPLA